ncbi:MAG: SRPBCC domain-containing protein [Nocardioides sp.]
MSDPTYEVSISRWFAAPPDTVFRAFTDREQLGQWFGPLMFTVPTDSVDVDVRAGGHLRATMVGKDDPTWRAPVDISLTEVIDDRLIVGYEVARGFPGLEDGTRMGISIELVPENGGTRLELRQGPVPSQMRDMTAVGWTQAFAKLDGLLATPAPYRNSPTNPGD